MALIPDYIPTTDPFAVFGIILLFLTLVVMFVLLCCVARGSAQDVWSSVRTHNLFQRLLRLLLQKEAEEVKEFEEAIPLVSQESVHSSAGIPAIIETPPTPSPSSSFSSKRPADADPDAQLVCGASGAPLNDDLLDTTATHDTTASFAIEPEAAAKVTSSLHRAGLRDLLPSDNPHYEGNPYSAGVR